MTKSDFPNEKFQDFPSWGCPLFLENQKNKNTVSFTAWNSLFSKVNVVLGDMTHQERENSL